MRILDKLNKNGWLSEVYRLLSLNEISEPAKAGKSVPMTLCEDADGLHLVITEGVVYIQQSDLLLLRLSYSLFMSELKRYLGIEAIQLGIEATQQSAEAEIDVEADVQADMQKEKEEESQTLVDMRHRILERRWVRTPMGSYTLQCPIGEYLVGDQHWYLIATTSSGAKCTLSAVNCGLLSPDAIKLLCQQDYQSKFVMYTV